MPGLRFQLVPRPGRPDFLDLPWDQPLADWESERLAVVARGIGRHVVRFVEYAGVFYALKELPHEIAHREYRLLRALNDEGLPAVEAVGIVHRPGPLEDVLLTRYLEFSLPYRLVLARKPVADVRAGLSDALAELLVRTHLAGFFWGDCSLSNTLFRRDAGALVAYLVDLETGERHDELSDPLRAHDLDIAEENLTGELLDLEAQVGVGDLGDPAELGADVRRSYERLWEELTAEEEFTVKDSSLLADRLRRLNERGFDVDEFELAAVDGGYRLTIRPQVVDPGHHRRRLLRLTGLDAQENQARRLLRDIDEYRTALEEAGQSPVSDTALAGRWLTEVFEPTIAAVPKHKWTKRQAAQLYHELLEHRWYLSEQAGKPVPFEEAVRSYLEDVLPSIEDERAIIVDQRATDE
jgi:tRNA A-37 threonylcarbamoyl transferase component Bud32